MKSIFNFNADPDDDDGEEPAGIFSPALEGLFDYMALLSGGDAGAGDNINGSFAPSGFSDAPALCMDDFLTTQRPVGVMAPLRFDARPAPPFRLRLK